MEEAVTKQVPLVFPTAPWQVRGMTDLEGAKSSAPNNGGRIQDYCFVYYRRGGDDQIFCQKLYLTWSDAADVPWSLDPQDEPYPVFDIKGTPFLSQAPASVAEIEGMLYFVINEASVSDTTFIYKTRYDGVQGYAPIGELFSNQKVQPFGAPAIGYNKYANNVMGSVLVMWPGGGYHYTKGWVRKNADEYGDDVEFQLIEPGIPVITQVPGTDGDYVSFDVSLDQNQANYCGITPYSHEGKHGFLLLMPYQTHDDAPVTRYGYSMYDIASGECLLPTVTEIVDAQSDNSLSYDKELSLASIEVAVGEVIPVLVDRLGNTRNFIFDDTAPNLGFFGEWQINPITSPGGGGGISVDVGIPPSIALSGDVGGSDDIVVTGAMIVSSKQSGGVLITSVLDTPALDENSISVAACCLNYKLTTI